MVNGKKRDYLKCFSVILIMKSLEWITWPASCKLSARVSISNGRGFGRIAEHADCPAAPPFGCAVELQVSPSSPRPSLVESVGARAIGWRLTSRKVLSFTRHVSGESPPSAFRISRERELEPVGPVA